MPLDVAVYQFLQRMLRDVRDPALARMEAVNLAAGTYSQGQILGQLSAGATNDVQTITVTGTPTGGTFKLSLEFPIGNVQTTAAIAYNASAATVQAALVALSNVGSGNVTCTGGALPGTPVVATFGGLLAGRPVPVMTLASNAFTGGSSPTATIAHTTTGSTGGQFAAYDGTKLTDPTTAPTVAGNGSGSSFAAGTYAVSYTLLTSLGESLPSPATMATATAAQNLRVSAITAPTGCTGANYYVNGVWAGTTAASSGSIAQTDLTGATLATGKSAPTASTAFTAPNGAGTHIALCILATACVVDNSGYVGFSTGSTGGLWGEKALTAPAYYSGSFNVADLVGLNATAVSQLAGRFAVGGLSGGVFTF